MHAYLNITVSPPVDVFAAEHATVVAETRVSPEILDAWSDDDLVALGLVRAAFQPVLAPAGKVADGYTPAKVGGQWVMAPQYRDKIAAEVAMDWQNLRAERDVRLITSTALLDRHRNQRDFGLPITMTDEQASAWAAYAQALRDLPEATTDPANPDWPEVPA